MAIAPYEREKMDHIIAGRFETKSKADAAAAAIVRYIDRSDICIFHNNAPGQHGAGLSSGESEANPGLNAENATSATTAMAAGLAAGVVGMAGGPVVALAAAGVAAYTGSLLGAMGGMQDEQSRELPNLRPAGVILAVRIPGAGLERFVINDLRNSGAADVEQADGQWRDGDWIDFDPVRPPHPVAA